MTQDDRDLSAAFDDLTAPPSTANYATRTSGLDGRTRTLRLPQVLATALAVAVALAGAGTFLALRTSRQSGGPASSASEPPARSNAAMAYDSSAGVTVMFGGNDAAGRTLADAWTWDGSAWKAAAHGPGPLMDTRMVDDPADGGVLLLGVPAVPVSGGGGSVGSSGCAGSGTASPGSVSGGAPAATAAAGPAKPPVGSVPTDGSTSIAPAPSSATPPTNVSAPAPAVSCPPVPLPVVPAAQTWLFSGGAWSRASGAAGSTPPAGAQLAFDSSTRQVVAISAGLIPCGPRMLTPGNVPPVICPLLGSGAEGAAYAPCQSQLGCPSFGDIATWTWWARSWHKEPAGQKGGGITLLFNDPGTQHATLMAQTVGPQCLPTVPCAAIAVVPTVTTWTWSGSGWMQKSQLHNVLELPSLGGATVAAAGGEVLVLTSAGDTWRWSAGHWAHDATTPSGVHPNARIGAAMAEGPGGTVVLFGGEVLDGFHVASTPATEGADTWVWDARSWRHAGGVALPAPPSPVPCAAQKDGIVPPCVEPQPAQVPPAAAASPSPSPT